MPPRPKRKREETLSWKMWILFLHFVLTKRVFVLQLLFAHAVFLLKGAQLG